MRSIHHARHRGSGRNHGHGVLPAAPVARPCACGTGDAIHPPCQTSGVGAGSWVRRTPGCSPGTASLVRYQACDPRPAPFISRLISCARPCSSGIGHAIHPQRPHLPTGFLCTARLVRYRPCNPSAKVHRPDASASLACPIAAGRDGPTPAFRCAAGQVSVIRTMFAQNNSQTWHPVHRPRQRRHLRGDVGRGAGHDPVSSYC